VRHDHYESIIHSAASMLHAVLQGETALDGHGVDLAATFEV